MIRATLLALLEGSAHANFVAPWGKPAPVRLPDDPTARGAMIDAHISGAPFEVKYAPRGRESQRIGVDALSLAAFCPAADGRCRWLAIDLDAADHGAGGLADPIHAARTIAERAVHAGLGAGLLVAHSRGGLGRHVFMIPPEPCSLADGVLGIAALVASAYRVAASDVSDADAPHAFRCADGAIAKPGQPGAVELIPRSATRPEFGWALALPAAGAFASRGGGIIVDPFTDSPIELRAIPRADARNWARFIGESRAELMRRTPAKREPLPATRRSTARRGNDPLESADARTREFVGGRAPEGSRNRAAFAGACDLLARGVDHREVEGLILTGAAACGLPANEARAAVASAIGAMRRRGKLQ